MIINCDNCRAQADTLKAQLATALKDVSTLQGQISDMKQDHKEQLRVLNQQINDEKARAQLAERQAAEAKAVQATQMRATAAEAQLAVVRAMCPQFKNLPLAPTNPFDSPIPMGPLESPMSQ